MQYAVYLLTCKDRAEAKKIAAELLAKKLAVCVKFTAVESMYMWRGELNDDSEELLIIESSAEKFDAITTLLDQIHSYDQYVLTMLDVGKTTPGVLGWLNEEMG